MKSCKRLGIDIGSTTVKIAVLDSDNHILFADYERHYANIQETLALLLSRAKEKLEEMADVDVRTVDISTLTDLRDIKIDTSLPVRKKLEEFARQTNNIYVNRIGDYVVKVKFQKDGDSIDDKMEEYLNRLSKVHL